MCALCRGSQEASVPIFLRFSCLGPERPECPLGKSSGFAKGRKGEGEITEYRHCRAEFYAEQLFMSPREHSRT